jgi:hypothetical protein
MSEVGTSLWAYLQLFGRKDDGGTVRFCLRCVKNEKVVDVVRKEQPHNAARLSAQPVLRNAR